MSLSMIWITTRSGLGFSAIACSAWYTRSLIVAPPCARLEVRPLTAGFSARILRYRLLTAGLVPVAQELGRDLDAGMARIRVLAGRAGVAEHGDRVWIADVCFFGAG